MASIPDLSVQLYSVRHQLTEDFTGTIARLADIGFTRVEPFGMLAFAEQLKDSLANAGLSAPTAHQVLDGEDDIEAIFQAAVELNVDTVIHPFTPAERWQSPDDVDLLADMLNRAAATAADHGLRVAYHNHDWELSTHFDDRPALEHFTDRLDPTVLLEIDAYWAATGGADVPALLQRLGDRVIALHLKDGPLNGDITAQLPLGQGDLPAADVVAAATALQYPVIEFDEYAGDIFEGIATSYAYATSTLGAQR